MASRGVPFPPDTAGKPFKAKGMFDQVVVIGRPRTEATRNDLASASYVIEATRVEPDTPKSGRR
jgi:hypothetical protein